MAKLNPRKVQYQLQVEVDDTPVRGNVSAHNDEEDRKAEDWVHAQMLWGNVWAWCVVTCVATYPGLDLQGTDVLGGCSYRNENAFKRGGYWRDMKAQALADLQAQVDRMAAQLQQAGVL